MNEAERLKVSGRIIAEQIAPILRLTFEEMGHRMALAAEQLSRTDEFRRFKRALERVNTQS